LNVEEADRVLQDLWDLDAKAWEKNWVPIFRRFAHDLVTDAGISVGNVVLDVGTGTGVAAIEAAKRVKSKGTVIGIDRSDTILQLAKAKGEKIENMSFQRMNSQNMIFPDGFFDAVISNCGLAYADFHETVSEIFRVMQGDASFTFNDWHLIDVPAHKVFSEILRRCRTNQPSEKLSTGRAAIAMLEHVGNRYSDLKVQKEELEGIGFRNMQVKQRDYKIWLPGIQEYLTLRLEREALQQELSELSKAQRSVFMKELRTGLKDFMHSGRFLLEWKVTFIRVTKPR